MTVQELLNQKREKFRIISLEGNHLALDFINTVDNRGSPKEYDWLTTYGDAIVWAEQLKIIQPKATKKLFEDTHHHKTVIYHHQIIETRENLRQIFEAVINDTIPHNQTWKHFNEMLQWSMRNSAVKPNNEGYTWYFPHIEDDPIGFLQPILKDAADLLITGDLSRVKRCADEICGWFFLDLSKNKSRRWCSMKDCGNRTKVKRHYERKKNSGG